MLRKMCTGGMPGRKSWNWIGLFALGLLLGAVLHLNLSCWDSFNFGSDEEPIDKVGIETGAANIETAFLQADTAALSSILTETSHKLYQGGFAEMLAYMPDFGTAFKSRKLLYANQIFAVYEYSSGGNTYTVEMTRDDDGTWKLTRF